MSLRQRSEIPAQYTFDLHSVFPDDAAWEAAITEVQSLTKAVQQYQGRLQEGPAVLAEALQKLEELSGLAGKVMVYGSLHWVVDTTNPQTTAMSDRARGIMATTRAATAFLDPELLSIGRETLQAWMEQEPSLQIFAHYFDALEQRRGHVRSAEVEELLGQVADPFRTAAMTHSILTDADMTFEPAQPSDPQAESRPVAQGTIGALLTDPDREVRRTAFEHYTDAYLAHRNTMANALAAGIKQDVFMARARRYNNSLEAALHENHLPVEVFHNTINTFRQNLGTWHRYWRLRRKALGYDQLHIYDIKAPLTSANPHVPYEQAVEWIIAGMAPLGEEYVQTMRRGLLEERWVDVYPNIGKRSGAFSSGTHLTHPFIMMSYTDDVFSMSTLAHELGHSMHSYFSRRSQPFIYSRYTLFVAEVASNFNQALVRDYLLKHNDDRDFQIAVLEEAMSNFHRYFFIMPTLARFELEIHERVERGEALTAKNMITLMADLFREGYGDEVVMDEERAGITWGTFPTHLYSNFYVFQYATGIAAAHALAERILAGDKQAVDNYLAFLRAGDSLYPLDALRLAGVDMTSPEPVEKAFATLAGYVERLEQLLAA